ncbi:MAG: hypothetical protein KatS3mg015_1507 [Fimbriimonadales bacterium]|jgi:hypothetical protein|nr:MAG: hypothetical protein KatS3mg015_1507 [Fimbriimonadales bacterium]
MSSSTVENIRRALESFATEFEKAQTAEHVCALVAKYYGAATYKYLAIFLRYIGEGCKPDEALAATRSRLYESRIAGNGRGDFFSL